jgi:beta-phosphoglucomutase
MKYKAIIFDLDGVICHTDHHRYLAWKQWTDKKGIYFDRKINNRLNGTTRMESLEIILEKWQGDPLTQEEKIQLTEEVNTIYKDLLSEMTEKDLSKEVKDTLDHLRKRGFYLAIGSSSKNVRLILEQIGLYNYFDAISDGNNISKPKPDPEVYQKAAEFLNINPSLCLVVEDTRVGIDAARAAGMDSAAIGDAFGYSEATYNLFTFSKLVQICCAQ